MHELDSLGENESPVVHLVMTEEAERALHDPKIVRSILATLPGVDPNSPVFRAFLDSSGP
jgi:hypothetical protein